MKLRHPISLAILSFTLGLSAASGGMAQSAAPFAPGERLTYEVTWAVFHAGQVTATLQSVSHDGHNFDTVRTRAISQGFVSILFKVNDTLQSYFDPKTLCSFEINKVINEGGRHKVTHIVFDRHRRLAILEERDPRKPSLPEKHAENKIPRCVEDVVSAFYYVRSQPLRVGEVIHLPVNDGAKTYNVEAHVQALEKIRTPMGEREAFRVQPEVFGSLFKRKGQMLIWFSDDPQHFPLKIQATLFGMIGTTITGELTSVTSVAPNAPSH